MSKFNDQNKAGSPLACVSIGEFILDWTSPKRPDSIGWTLSRLRARRVVAQNVSALQARACAKATAGSASP
ncbi:MAG: hypothetical protein M3Y64_08700, partial [Gemmatimonadota bacterium]|nr:hypothetical protein [Gemmatimonadota bacterium]